ncbi:MAG: carboxypeptidase-like regulatory domain-containing protein [PVC group bacterium]
MKRNKMVSKGLLSVILLVLACCFNPENALCICLSTETVEVQPSGLSNTSLAFDWASQPHVCYTAPLSRSDSDIWIKYAFRDKGIWKVEPVVPQDDLGIINKAIIKLNKEGKPYIFIGFWADNQYNVSRIYKMDSIWQIDDLYQSEAGDDYLLGAGCTFALDIRTDPVLLRPHIVLIATSRPENRSEIRYVRPDGSGWIPHILAEHSSGNNYFFSPSLAIDRLGRAHIVYSSHWLENFWGNWWTMGKFEYAQWDGSRWTRELLLGPINDGLYQGFPSRLVLDSGNRPHICLSIFRARGGGLIYLRREGYYNWESEIIGYGIHSSEFALTVDFDDNAHIAYHSYNPDDADEPGEVRYLVGDGSSFEEELVEANHESSEFSIGIDWQKKPHIIYHDYNQGLNHACEGYSIAGKISGWPWVWDRENRMFRTSGIAGVQVTVQDARGTILLAHSAYTNAEGYYTVECLPGQKNYTVVPSKFSYRFYPADKSLWLWRDTENISFSGLPFYVSFGLAD